MDSPQHTLVLPFDTDAPEFARGFEAGALWADLRDGGDALEAVVHASNTEMVLRMAEALGREALGEVLDATWTRVVFSAPEAAAGSSPRPDHL